MIGTLINTGAIVLGTLIGLLLKKALPKDIDKPIMTVEGVAIMIIGLNGMLTRMFTVEDGKVSSHGELILLISLVVGTLIGTLLDLDGKIAKAGNALERRFGKDGFAGGFINASLIFCIGAMSIMGPIAERLEGDMSILLEKSIMDGISAILFAVAMGWGVIGAAVSVLVVQGFFALLANLFVGVSSAMLADFFIVGFSIIMCIGYNFTMNTKIKTANMIPALLVPIVYNLFT